jgi:subtilisin
MSSKTIPFVSVVLLILFGGLQPQSPRAAAAGPQVPNALRDRAAREGRVRVLVELTVRPVPRGADETRRGVEARLLSKLSPSAHRVVRRFQAVPYIALEVTRQGLSELENTGSVVRVIEDQILRPALADSVPLIEGDQVWEQGFDGTGKMVAIIDSGVDASHPFLAGKVIEEACYSATSPGLSQSACPNGLEEQIGPGAAAPCALDDCVHGTHVAGIAAGNGALAGQPFSGVAKGARIMAVQVFSKIIDPITCGGIVPCLGAFSSDIMAGLERVHAVAPQYDIAAVNMSLGGTQFTTPCDDEPYKPAIDALRAVGIVTIVAAGNNASTNSLTSPACISSAVSVGSVDKSDTISWFSNVAPFL